MEIVGCHLDHVKWKMRRGGVARTLGPLRPVRTVSDPLGVFVIFARWPPAAGQWPWPPTLNPQFKLPYFLETRRNEPRRSAADFL